MTKNIKLLATGSCLALAVFGASPALAVGTTSGTTITNTVTVDFQVGGVSQTASTGSNAITVDLKGLSNLFGTDLKYDIGKGVDLGFSGSLRQNPKGGSYSWSGGPTVGIAAMKNGYVSIGYNVTGFSDRDYDAARYTRSGPFVTLRMKFDQGLLAGLGLGR